MIELVLSPDPFFDAGVDEAPRTAPAAAIEHTYFKVPVRFRVAGVELLAFPGVYPDWRPLPVLGFASQLWRTVSHLESGEVGTVSLEDGGALEFFREGETFRIKPSLLPVEVAASRAEFIAVAKQFSTEACDFAQSVAPAIAGHPSWREWSGAVS